jgi:hypothetical protein
LTIGGIDESTSELVMKDNKKRVVVKPKRVLKRGDLDEAISGW